jgi:hypothetical protein
VAGVIQSPTKIRKTRVTAAKLTQSGALCEAPVSRERVLKAAFMSIVSAKRSFSIAAQSLKRAGVVVRADRV